MVADDNKSPVHTTGTRADKDELREIAAAAIYNQRHGMWSWAEGDTNSPEHAECFRYVDAILEWIDFSLKAGRE